jgi:hypothetical protein
MWQPPDRKQAFRDGKSRALGPDWAQVQRSDSFHAIDARPLDVAAFRRAAVRLCHLEFWLDRVDR